MSFFTAQIWKIATGGAAIISIVLGIALTMSYMENRSLISQVAKAERSINDPKTGYVVRLVQCRTNAAALQVALDKQTRALKDRAASDASALQSVTDQLRDTQRRNRERGENTQRVFALPPKGVTLEDHYEDIDKRLLETLK